VIDVNKLTLTQIKQLGIDALTSVLGPAGMGLFMHQFEMGSGDYTQDRDKILGNPSIKEICDRIKQQRQQTEILDASPKFINQNYVDVSQLTKSQIRQMGIEALTRSRRLESGFSKSYPDSDSYESFQVLIKLITVCPQAFIDTSSIRFALIAVADCGRSIIEPT
jgi:hypothetical protein